MYSRNMNLLRNKEENYENEGEDFTTTDTGVSGKLNRFGDFIVRFGYFTYTFEDTPDRIFLLGHCFTISEP